MTTNDPVAGLLERLSPDVRELMQHIRGMVRTVLPQLEEHVYLGWGTIHFRSGRSLQDMLFAADPQRSYVNLEFRDGTALPDPAHRLEGSGKRLRHVKIRTAADTLDPALHVLLLAEARFRGVQ